MDKVAERLHLHYCAAEAYAAQHGCELMSVCLRGSQNYGLDTEDSDVDSVAFVVPVGEALIFDDKISKELHIDDEHCVVKDIRFLYYELCKGSPNMIEALMTDFYFDNPKYHYAMTKFRINRERYARINPDQTIDALCGMGFSKTGKNYHAVKNLEMIQRYIKGEPFKQILISNRLAELKMLKAENIRDESACSQLKEILNRTKEYTIDEYAKSDLRFYVRMCFDADMLKEA